MHLFRCRIQYDLNNLIRIRSCEKIKRTIELREAYLTLQRVFGLFSKHLYHLESLTFEFVIMNLVFPFKINLVVVILQHTRPMIRQIGSQRIVSEGCLRPFFHHSLQNSTYLFNRRGFFYIEGVYFFDCFLYCLRHIQTMYNTFHFILFQRKEGIETHKLLLISHILHSQYKIQH